MKLSVAKFIFIFVLVIGGLVYLASEYFRCCVAEVNIYDSAISDAVNDALQQEYLVNMSNEEIENQTCESVRYKKSSGDLVDCLRVYPRDYGGRYCTRSIFRRCSHIIAQSDIFKKHPKAILIVQNAAKNPCKYLRYRLDKSEANKLNRFSERFGASGRSVMPFYNLGCSSINLFNIETFIEIDDDIYDVVTVR